MEFRKCVCVCVCHTHTQSYHGVKDFKINLHSITGFSSQFLYNYFMFNIIKLQTIKQGGRYRAFQ